MTNKMFWIASSTLAGLVTLLLGLALFRHGRVEGSAVSDVQVYRDQLKEVERDLERGVIAEAEAEQIRLEVSRRLLEADRAATEEAAEGAAPRAATMVAAGFVALVLIGGGGLLYSVVGAPGYPDLPLQARIDMAEEMRLTRPDQAAAESQIPPSPPVDVDAEFLDLMEKLRAAVAERPNDIQGHEFLARYEAQLGNFTAARQAQARVVEIKGDGAGAADYARLADLLVLAAGGYVSPEAEAVLRRTLELDPANGTARYYSGLLAVQTGRPDVGFRIFRALLEGSAPDDPWVTPIRAQIEDLAFLAGVNYVPPAATQMRGPTEADIAAAEEMSPAERMQMIEGMVTGLSERLATEGGPPEDWARLIRALGVLGQQDRARAIWEEAQRAFPDEAMQVPILRAARDAGIAQ
ncbi:c-type cytochrome biogenesis protein CcmI [Ovoidimarina sediminis]|uniref:c-type cytochrome biogenesis protein CcmI n=1 Tax=Ovoidimarina sediminis TaxID=3079856 RepID=UPI0029096949|nr:c-type cytochrome biogenesis protein CcmI [Rhodophyticola sp. MJ-SS7]MDU8943213.1 c-type cytochrome biogenesis protein CcmI [Rhodophyticola sp. MJ-SS7]